MRLGKLAVAGLAFAALAMVFAGCVHFTSGPTAKQIGKKPKVKVKFEVCAEASNPDNPCQPASNSDEASFGFGRLLVGFRVPKGTKTPDTFQPKAVGGAAGFTPGSSAKLHRNDLYTSELNQLAPKGPKYKWVGYQSDPVDADDSNPVPFLEGTFRVKLGLPKGFDKKKFKVRPVIGGVASASDPDFELPDCGSSPYELQEEGVTAWICIDDPSPSEVETHIKVKLKQKD